MAKKWIAKAISKPGVLRKEFGVKPGETIPAAELQSKITRLRKKSEAGTITKAESKNLKRANLAKTLKSLPKRGSEK